jgi:copper homeostasis protein
MKRNTYTIEIATADFSTTKSSVEGGADRIELCANLDQGGTTPSYGTLLQCRENFDVALFAIIRPRSGDFYYTDDEFAIMRHEVKLCKELGCDGVVIGLLNRDGSIDLKRTARLIEMAYPMEVTFHRAFDRSDDPFKALEQLIEVGCQRLLTSGQQPTAPEGAALIGQLVEKAADRIIIMPGSGVRKENIKDLALRTGTVEFHSSLRARIRGRMDYVHPSFTKEDYTIHYIDPAEVQSLRAALLA